MLGPVSNQLEPASRQPDQRLNSWKEIACFFNREVRTVQLWEKNEGLPVWRHHHNRRRFGSVYAFRDELQAWRLASSSRLHNKTAWEAAPYDRSKKPTRDGATEKLDRKCEMAIVPFSYSDLSSNMASGAEGLARFAHGLTDELICQLGRVGLKTKVHPAQVCESGMPGESCWQRVTQEVKAPIILVGCIRFSTDRVRVSMYIVGSRNSTILWSRAFDALRTDKPGAQQELASRIAAAIPAAELLVLSSTFSPDRYSEEQAAYHACMLGRYFWEQRSNAALLKALKYFEQAVELDSDCNEAYAGMVDCYVSLSDSHCLPTRLAMEKANIAAEQLMRRKPHSVAAHNCMANVMLHCNWNWARAEQETVSGCEYDPRNSRAIQLYSILLSSKVAHQQAIDMALRAQHIDPLSKVLNNEVGYAYYYSQQYEEALPFVRRGLAIDPDYMMGHVLLGMTQTALGQPSEALASLSRACELSGRAPFTLALTSYAHARMGDEARSRSVLEQLERGADAWFPAFNSAAAYLALGEKDRALASLKQAQLQRDVQLVCLGSDPRFTGLHPYPEFQEILTSMNLRCA